MRSYMCMHCESKYFIVLYPTDVFNIVRFIYFLQSANDLSFFLLKAWTYHSISQAAVENISTPRKLG